jgi:proteasome accessory factor A
MSALEMQSEFLTRVRAFAEREGILGGSNPDPTATRVVELWERTLRAVESDDLSLVEREIDWVVKWRMLERYGARHGLTLEDPRLLQLDLAYHDIDRRRGLFHLLQRRGLVTRECTDLEIFRAKTVPPQTTRARLRGEFVRAAQAKRRDFSVDWVHLKLNDQAQRTVLCKDPFTAVDARVQRLIDAM